MAFYAFQHKEFPCEKALKVFDGVKSPALSILWDSFGSRNRCLKEYLTRFRNQPHILQIHISNQTCVRNGRRCTEFDLQSMNPAKLRQRLKRISGFCRVWANENTRLIVSTGLEDQYSPEQFRKVYQIIHSEWSHEISTNPIFLTNRLGLIEFHSPRNGIQIYSNDGEYISPRLFAKRMRIRRYELGFYWWDAQGITDKFIEPRKRKIVIRKSDINEVNKLLKGQL